LAITPDYNEYIRGLERYEFKSLIQELREEAARAGVARQGELELG
jgi:hypothetical protein